MEKCHMCKERIEHGLEPACVHTCPTKALSFGEINELAQRASEKASTKIFAVIANLR